MMIIHELNGIASYSRKLLFAAPYGSRFHDGVINGADQQIIPPKDHRFKWEHHQSGSFKTVHFSYGPSMKMVKS